MTDDEEPPPRAVPDETEPAETEPAETEPDEAAEDPSAEDPSAAEAAAAAEDPATEPDPARGEVSAAAVEDPGAAVEVEDPVREVGADVSVAATEIAPAEAPVDDGGPTSTPDDAPEEPTDDAPQEPTDLAPGGRPLALRLARLHLRMGSLALARAELESFAAGDLLDAPALLDLAEARWRTGDLAGAGEAANAALGRGVEDPLAYVVAAEAVAAVGRPAEARRLAARALAGTGGSLDSLFAGMPRSLIWPADTVPEEAYAAAHGRSGRAGADGAGGPASAAAAEAFAGGRGSLARGDTAAAALRLGVAIRLEPGFAEGVLNAIGERASEPVLALVAGDALRLLGREHDALAAYDTARGKPPAPADADAQDLWPDAELS